MSIILDLHIHSRFSRACSPQLTLENIDEACRIKGVDIISSGDFTFPNWYKSLQSDLEETAPGSGLYRYHKSLDNKVSFLIGTEVSLVYRDGNKARRIHLVVHAPDLKSAGELNKQLDKRFNIRSDGRPILGISAPDFVKMVLDISPSFLVYPAHIWTPWYSVFGSKSGFNSLEECFHDQVENIYAYETGLSSDPAMNWRVSALDKLTLISSSDAHSLANIAREATKMELSADQVTYRQIYDNIRHHRGLDGTIEFYPEEGMYHIDGYRACGFSCLPSESKRHKGLCPVCHKPLVIGVLNRAEELSDRPVGYVLKDAPGFKKVVELDKILAGALKIKNRSSKVVQNEYHRLINHLGPELKILLDVDLKEMTDKGIDERIIEGIRRMRLGELEVVPGFDGQYGRISVFTNKNSLNK